MGYQVDLGGGGEWRLDSIGTLGRILPGLYMIGEGLGWGRKES